tara:strand:- start:320 stop:889 length:570 start_codon:yes stop_codon:yes gene_type:complete
MILIIDNYDSFTYNLFQYTSEFCSNIEIKKNNTVNMDYIKKSNLSHIIISPGPGNPQNSGICTEVIKFFYKKIPILGVCLGHQIIGEAFGATIKQHHSIMHGKVDTVIQNYQSVLFKNVPQSFKATRYHSLIVDGDTLSSSFRVTSSLKDGTIMSIEHKHYTLYGVQFHPESIETTYGKEIIKNFINIV